MVLELWEASGTCSAKIDPSNQGWAPERLISSPSITIYHHSLFITHWQMTISTLLILAVCRMPVIHEPGMWVTLPWVLHSSMVRASDRCTEGHRFNSCQGLRFFLCPMLATCWSHYFSFFFSLSLKVPSFFIYHTLDNFDIFILAVCIMHVINEP